MIVTVKADTLVQHYKTMLRRAESRVWTARNRDELLREQANHAAWERNLNQLLRERMEARNV